MARFASLAELEVFLCMLEPDYAQYASVLWQQQVRTANQLANASKPLLLSWGLLELHVDDIKARAVSTGEHSDYNDMHLTKVFFPCAPQTCQCQSASDKRCPTLTDSWFLHGKEGVDVGLKFGIDLVQQAVFILTVHSEPGLCSFSSLAEIPVVIPLGLACTSFNHLHQTPSNLGTGTRHNLLQKLLLTLIHMQSACI